MFDMIHECASDVHPLTVASVIQVESAGDQYAIAPVILKEDRKRLPKVKSKTADSLDEAVDKAESLLDKGYSVSLGLMQINSMHYSRFNVSVEEVFDPCINIMLGAKILSENYIESQKVYDTEAERVHAMLSAYYSGSFKSRVGSDYVDKVVKAAQSIEVPAAPGTSHQVKGSNQVALPQSRQLVNEAFKSDIHVEAFSRLGNNNDGNKSINAFKKMAENIGWESSGQTFGESKAFE